MHDKMNKESVSLGASNKDSKKNYFRHHFKFRIYHYLIILIIFAFGLVYSLSMTFPKGNNEKIKYSEKSQIDYQVYLKDNDFYDTPYLKKGMAYVASLIKKVNVNFDYNFTINKESYLKQDNKINARLIIGSQNNDKTFFEKEFELKEINSELINDKKEYNLKESITIDYDYYNRLANKFKSNYAVNTSSYLEIYMTNIMTNQEKNAFELNKTSETLLSIPLSEQEINIGINEKTVNNSDEITLKQQFKIGNPIYIIADIILLLSFIIYLIKLLKRVSLMSNKKSGYDRYVDKLLRGYDRLIINVETPPNLDDYNIIRVESFNELVDLRDNIKEPINYYVITKHERCEFFITNHNDLYIYTIESIDFE